VWDLKFSRRVKMPMAVFRVVAQCGPVVGTSVKEEHTASIVMAEVLNYVLNARATDFLCVVYLDKAVPTVVYDGQRESARLWPLGRVGCRRVGFLFFKPCRD
jgi:hypothetical protein